jgi:hypothetical protein
LTLQAAKPTLQTAPAKVRKHFMRSSLSSY